MKNISISFWAFIIVSTLSFIHGPTILAQKSSHKFFVPKEGSAKSSNLPVFVEVLADAENPQKFILLVNNPCRERLHITVRSHMSYGYDETTSEAVLRKRFDMTGAEDGLYTVTVNSGTTAVTKQIQLATRTEVTRSIAIK